MALAIQGKEKPGRAFPVGDTWYIITDAHYISEEKAMAEAEQEEDAITYAIASSPASEGYWECNVRPPVTEEDYAIIKEEQEIFYTKHPDTRPEIK